MENILPKGGASFHDWRTVHGSEPNRSAGPRRGLAIHLCSEHSVPMGGSLTRWLSDPRANPGESREGALDRADRPIARGVCGGGR